MAFMKAVLAQTYPPPTPPPPPPPPPPPETPAPSPTPSHSPRATDLLDEGQTVALIVRSGSISDDELQQAACSSFASKQIFCGGPAQPATAGAGSRFFTAPPQWFETFNLYMSFGGQQYGASQAYTLTLSVAGLLVSPRSGDGFAAPDPSLAQLYRRDIVVLGKTALFSLCPRRNILLGSEQDERPTVFECFR